MSVRWCFTHNNADSGWRPLWDPSIMVYLVWERETAPSTGRHHIQGFVRLTQRKRINQVKAILHSEELHLEPAKGSDEQNKQYCSKERVDNDWGESGTIGHGQGHRSDLDEVAEELLKGQSLGDVAASHPATWMRYHAGIISFSLQVVPQPPLRREVTTTVLWGPTGTGKSHRVLTAYPDSAVISPGRDPFSMYTNQKVVIFEEFDDEVWPVQEMNRYLDVWRCKCNCRYNDKWAHWEKVFILSNKDPSHWYQYKEEKLRAAFFRRLNQITYVETKEQIISI